MRCCRSRSSPFPLLPLSLLLPLRRSRCCRSTSGRPSRSCDLPITAVARFEATSSGEYFRFLLQLQIALFLVSSVLACQHQDLSYEKCPFHSTLSNHWRVMSQLLGGILALTIVAQIMYSLIRKLVFLAGQFFLQASIQLKSAMPISSVGHACT